MAEEAFSASPSPADLLHALMVEARRFDIPNPFGDEVTPPITGHLITAERAVSIYADLVGGEFPRAEWDALVSKGRG